MSRQSKNNQTGLLIGAGAIVILMMAGALFFLHWVLNTDPASAPPMALTAVVLILPVIVTFALFVLLVQRIWKLPKNSGTDPEKTDGGDAA